MLRNMKLGTKLLAVILPPLIVLVVVAGIGAKDRLDQAADARSAENYIELAAATSALATTLQWERTATMYVIGGGDNEEAADILAERRERTDREAERVEAAIAALGSDPEPGLADLIDRAQQRSGELASFRGSLDAGTTDVWILQSYFDRAIHEHLLVTDEVANTVPLVEISSSLASYSALSRAKEAAAQTAAVYTYALTDGKFDPEGRIWRASRDAEAAFDRYLSLFNDISPLELSNDLSRTVNSASAREAEDMRLEVVLEVAPAINIFGDGTAITDPRPLRFDSELWIYLSENRLNGMNQVGSGILDDVTSFVRDMRTDAERDALLFLMATAAAVLVSGILAVVVARRVTKPLRELTVAADRMASEQLPALVEGLRSPTATATGAELEPINMKRNDEIGQLADAFDSIQRVTVDVAEEQASLLRKGIGDIFVNLARRNQTLLDRQIEFIDHLESQEEDPDVLEDLFKLDHLATRMRRNAESLLVLAGVETGHRRTRPVALADVVRVAIGEVEDFARLSIVSLDDAMISGTAAMDVAHMLSELMENATQFSPPETNVEILGHQSPDGYVISISDQGIGMSEEQFSQANRLLAEPPLVGLTMSRSLGFTVVGRLAARFGVSVRLTSSPTGGVTALVTVPPSILHEAQISVAESPTDAPSVPATQAHAPVEAQPEPIIETQAPPAPEPVVDAPSPTAWTETPTLDDVFGEPAPEPVAEPEPAAFAPPPPAPPIEPEPVVAPPESVPAVADPTPEWAAPEPAAADLGSSVPEGEDFDAGLVSLMETEPTVEPPPAEPKAPSIFSDAAMEAASQEAASPEYTSAGLVRRVPRANLPSSEEPSARPGARESVAAPQRSPEEVRAMLSRYRSGLQRASQSSDGIGSPSDTDGSN